MLELKLGSIFDEKADMIVVPCNSGGGVTNWVFRELKDRGLKPPGEVPYGQIAIEPTGLTLENAEYIGYAASVDFNANRSDVSAIERIVGTVLSFATSQGLEIINLPLLGTGAGGLSPLEVLIAYERIFRLDEAGGLRAVVFTPSRDIFKLLSARVAAPQKNRLPEIRPPRVFISYAGDDKDNARWTKELAIELRQNGVNARFDRFHLRPGVDLPQWMANEVIMAGKVILICDHHYMTKADIRRGGVGWETMVIQGDMLTQGETRAKYIALVREESVDKGLPIYMKSKLALHWKKAEGIDEEELRELMVTLFDFDMEPDLGEFPGYILELHSRKGRG